MLEKAPKVSPLKSRVFDGMRPVPTRPWLTNVRPPKVIELDPVAAVVFGRVNSTGVAPATPAHTKAAENNQNFDISKPLLIKRGVREGASRLQIATVLGKLS